MAQIPYLTQTEPAWMTDIAWARKIGVLSGLISDDERNAWELNRAGANAFDAVFDYGKNGLLPASQCFLWSTSFKRIFVPSYSPSPNDTPRPPKRRRKDSPMYYLTIMEQAVQEGKLDAIAEKITKIVGRPVRNTPLSCALAYKAWEDMLLLILGSIPAIVLRYAIARRPLGFGWALLLSLAILIGFLAVIRDMSSAAPTLAGAVGAISLAVLMLPSRKLSIRCPHCGSEGKLAKHLVNEAIECPDCKKTFAATDAVARI